MLTLLSCRWTQYAAYHVLFFHNFRALSVNRERESKYITILEKLGKFFSVKKYNQAIRLLSPSSFSACEA